MRLFSRDKAMIQNKQHAINRAKADLSKRLNITENQISEQTIEDVDFPDASLGVPVKDEMSAQMITEGVRIRLNANGKTYEYRTDAAGRELRLFQFNGANYIV